MTLATGAAASAGGSGFTLLILALPILFLLFLMFSQRRRAKAMADAQQQLVEGQEVMTTSGLYGVVTGVEAEVVHLRVSEGVVLRFQRRAIVPLSMVQGQGQGLESTPPASATDDEPTDETGQEPRR